MNANDNHGSLTPSSRATTETTQPLANGSTNPPRINASYSPSRQPTAGFPSPAPQRINGEATHPNGHAGTLLANGGAYHKKIDSGIADPDAFEDWDDDNFDESDPLAHDSSKMPSDLRPPFHRPTDGKSGTPLLDPHKKENGYASGEASPPVPPLIRRRSTFKERDPDAAAKSATRKRYSYAAFFLAVSLVSFTIQTETAVYIKKHLGWSKSYAML